MDDITQASAKTVRATAEEIGETLRTEVPSSFVDLFEKSVARTRDAHEKMTTILTQSTEAFGEAFSCANRGSAEYRVKLMEIARTNANATFDLAREMMSAKTLPELFESAVAHQRKQFELTTSQMKDLTALTQKVVTETTAPIRNGMSEPFRMAS